MVDWWKTALNINNPERHRLAARVAAITDESLTEAVANALRQRLARIETSGDLAADLLKPGEDCARCLKDPWRSQDHAALLCDENSLPK